MTMSLEPGHGETVLAYEKAMRERNRLLKDEVTDPRWYEALEAQMAATGGRLFMPRAARAVREGHGGGGKRVLVVPGRNPVARRPPRRRRRRWKSPDLAEALREGRSERTWRPDGRLVGPHRADLGAIYTRQRAPRRAIVRHGEQKALLISLVLANARALAEDTRTPAGAPARRGGGARTFSDADRRGRALTPKSSALGRTGIG